MKVHEFVPLEGSSDETMHRPRRHLRLGLLFCAFFNVGVLVMLCEARLIGFSRSSFSYEAVAAQAQVARNGRKQLGLSSRVRTGSHHGQLLGRNPILRATSRPRYVYHQLGMNAQGALRAISDSVASADKEELKDEQSTVPSADISLIGYPIDPCAPLVGQDFCSGDSEVCVGYIAAYREHDAFDMRSTACVGAWDWANTVLRDPKTAEGQWLLCGSTSGKIRDFFKTGGMQGQTGSDRMYHPQHFAALEKIDELCRPAKQDLS